MKLKNLYTTICLSALAFASCSEDELRCPHETVSGESMAISITDGGYADAGRTAGIPATRALENGYTTEFTAGDACGLYIVRDGEIIGSNLKLTAENANGTSSSTGGELVWKVRNAEGGDANLYYIPGDKYFVYYPYRQDMGGKVHASAGNEAGFFAPLVDGWQPQTDQSDYNRYTASDLMTAEGRVSEKDAASGKRTLSFSMAHCMALAVIEMPTTVYRFTNSQDGGIPDYTVISSANFGDNKPCNPSPGLYRYLVSPSGQTTPTLTGSYLGGKKEFAITPTGIPANHYQIYKVDGATEETKEHRLQIGDFFLADGHLLPKDADVLTVQATNVVGIVFQTDKRRIGAKEKEKLGGEDKVHGLVMSVKNAATNLVWSSGTTDDGLPKCETKADNYNDISGYGICGHIRQEYGNFDRHPAFKAADEYNNTCPVPATTTGWYFPSSGQWWDILQNLGGCSELANENEQTSQDSGDFSWTHQGDVLAALNAWMGKIAADSKNDFADDGFWSSSEASASQVRCWYMRFDGSSQNESRVHCNAIGKNDPGDVRPVLAF